MASSTPDVEDPPPAPKVHFPFEPKYDLKNLVQGYPKFAGWMGLRAQRMVFRLYSGLAARILLYRQGEIANLERRLIIMEKLCAQDATTDEHVFSADSWDELCEPERKREHKVIQEIIPKLREYHEDIIRLATITRFEHPRSSDIRDIQEYLQSWDMGPDILSGEDAGYWGSREDRGGKAPDLICINAPPREDAFTNFFVRNVVTYLFRLFPRRDASTKRDNGDICAKQRNLLYISRFITCIVASILPIAPTAILGQSSRSELGVLIGLNVLLASCLTIFTTARSAEVFGVTATFGALQVAVLTDPNHSGSPQSS